MTPSLLNLCARTKAHSFQSQQVAALCKSFQGWEDLLYQAEKHGMAPLLHMHLGQFEREVPPIFFYSLRILRLRHQKANNLLMKCLAQILSMFEADGIPCLVLKGAALSRTIYPEIGLRPMRDIDLLLSKEDVDRAHSLLQQDGFFATSDTHQNGPFHLSPLFQNVEGMRICVELHHGLFPYDPPYYQQLDFSELYQNRLAFDLEGMQAYALANEEMLWHVFQHGFHAPLTYEPFRLISVADIVSLVENRLDEIDWEKIRVVYPQLINALPLLHCITPWNDSLLPRKLYNAKLVCSGAGEPYNGWPRRKFGDNKGQNFRQILRHTLFPGQWWLMLYYSIDAGHFFSIWRGLVKHSLHILRWVKIYATISLKEKFSRWIGLKNS